MCTDKLDVIDKGCYFLNCIYFFFTKALRVKLCKLSNFSSILFTYLELQRNELEEKLI